MWKSKTTNVDKDTGEIIYKTKGYIKHITHKKITYNAKHTIGFITWTIEWRRNQQREFNFDNT